MSEVAGRMAVQIGARLLEKMSGGRGYASRRVSGVAPARVVIVGGGNVEGKRSQNGCRAGGGRYGS